ncbi:similar to ISWI chromatin-remodeling complex ATPase ISW2 [Plenodomus lingam JN3]|uniref:Similar to ISWI chromatin-remodeling complex ATPase ISW2 n=1 Tax=Leptosphaeria maculans (strain JN3 / isolate v23.1.3 / race Av1-4-5-6-7-8) TaxID=985895 RepID=E4ZQG6_LEPMJ|nr:similar to ISWI chromatin-remodeling complex ATPase ISW2 [Plenodomus lingam JN3]CBX93641.1 similar to ISWI chromatin-remodeling complex ATPase ISW2 [Plenodomus lingam JN3]
MAARTPILLSDPLPMTPPKRRGGHLQDLLAQFGSQKSSESVTKKRRTASQQKTQPEGAIAPPPPSAQDGDDSELRQRQSSPLNSASASASSPSSSDDRLRDFHETDSFFSSPESKPTKTKATNKPTQTVRSSRRTSTRQSKGTANEDESVDELAPSARPMRKISARISAYSEELKMEKRKREREQVQGLRRSGRDRKSVILESDTVPSPSPPRKKAPPPRKLDTARQRLRDDIANQSKTKANNFLVANKHYFLPLLPPNNQVARLAAKGDAGPIVEYEELTEQPKGVRATMKPYQLSGLSYLVHLYNNGFSGILGDEMGLGKTLQTLSLFQYLEELDGKNGVSSEEQRPYLIICPLSVLNSWVTEAEKWVPELKVLRFHGASTERARLKKVAQGMEDMKGRETKRAKDRKASKKAGRKLSKLSSNDQDGSYKIIVTTYDTFQSEQSWFKTAFVWRYVVLDEGHKIKSSVTQISTALRTISTEYRLILTGTPLQNNLVEMWALLAWLYPTVFVDKTETLFKESFDLNKGKVIRKTMDDARRLLELIMLRRMKDSPSVNLGLPPKEEVLLHVPLTPMQKFWYTRLLTRIDDGMLNKLFADGKTKERAAIAQDQQDVELLREAAKLVETSHDEWDETAEIMRATIAKEQESSDSAPTKGAWMKLMNLVMQLRKCCSHPYLLPGVAPDPYYLGDHIIRGSGKFILLEKLLKHTVFEQGKKVLIFSGFTRTLDYCEDLLSLISNRGEKFRHLRLDGSSARARRNLDIRLFNQEGSDYKVMLLSTRAGGLGINLTSAQDVIFLDEDWNPQITLQAEARAHRIGQTKPVTIYKLCTQGTVEEQMMGRIRKKLYLSAKITESMQSIHGKQDMAKKGRGHSSINEDMPQMDTSQLMTLVRRGAQTLSHPEIDVKEMVSWDLETMLENCRDKPADLTTASGPHSEIDEDKWLSVMERVECAVFDGKRHQRQFDKKSKSATSAANILPDSITREDRRKNKNTTVMVDGYAISKESMTCGDWEAVPTFAGKDPRLAEPVRAKKREFNHEEHCLVCFENADVGDVVECKSCPRAYHYDCLDGQLAEKVTGFRGFYCSQHKCFDCGKSTSDAGGLIYRCRWCPKGFCEDCLDWDTAELVGENLPEFELIDEGPATGGFYVKCPNCVEHSQENEEQREWLASMENAYKEQHNTWVREREAAQKRVEAHDVAALLEPVVALSRNVEHVASPPRIVEPIVIDDDDDDDVRTTSPPALTDTSMPTPALSGSRVSTPKLVEPLSKSKSKKRSICHSDEIFGETREEKRIRLDAQTWSMEQDPLLMGASL